GRPRAEKELKKIPFFVRGKARTNTETFARERHRPRGRPRAEKELKKIPFFVRGKARTNTETFARERH
ncbi:hypothetical protein CTI14_72265, partial [Methylobacterium radiotolerans]